MKFIVAQKLPHGNYWFRVQHLAFQYKFERPLTFHVPQLDIRLFASYNVLGCSSGTYFMTFRQAFHAEFWFFSS